MAKPTSEVGFVFYLRVGMKALLVSGSKDLSQNISLILKVRWPELSLVHATEARESIELVYRERPDIVMLQLPERSEGSASVDCFDLISRFVALPMYLSLFLAKAMMLWIR